MQKRRKKKFDPDAPIRPWAALITWLLLNIIWFYAVPASTPHPVLAEDSAHRTNYLLEVPDVFGRELPLHIECDFQPLTKSDEDVRVSWALYTTNAKQDASDSSGLESGNQADSAVVEWSGYLGEQCEDVDLKIRPGTYEMTVKFWYENGTEVRYDLVDDTAVSTLTMRYWIYEPVRFEGLIAANVLGFLVLVTDQVARRWARNKRIRIRDHLPLHKRRHKEEWESLHEEMDKGGEVTIESFQLDLGKGSEAEREAMRKRFADAAEAAAEDDDEVVTDELEQVDEDIGEGTVKGLEGDAKVDEDIETVRDIWERMEEDED